VSKAVLDGRQFGGVVEWDVVLRGEALQVG
jgi:hypothetical protein